MSCAPSWTTTRPSLKGIVSPSTIPRCDDCRSYGLGSSLGGGCTGGGAILALLASVTGPGSGCNCGELTVMQSEAGLAQGGPSGLSVTKTLKSRTAAHFPGLVLAGTGKSCEIVPPIGIVISGELYLDHPDSGGFCWK